MSEISEAIEREIDTAMTNSLKNIRPTGQKSEEALRFSQAALNLAHMRAIEEGRRSKGAGS